MQIIKKLSTYKTTADNQVDISHVNYMGNTPVMLFYLKQYIELNEVGLAHPVLNAGNNSSAVFATIGKKVVGVIVYKFDEDPLKTTWKILSAVDSADRGQGIYKAMHGELEKYAKSVGSRKIASNVHLNNKPAQEGNRSVGVIPVWYKMEKSIG